MRLSFNQPAFIPWGGFFARLLRSEAMVLLDETLLARGFTFVTRNRIKGPQGEHWISVPLIRKGKGRQKIRDLEIYEKERWARDFLRTLQHFYAKSVYFPSVFDKVREAVEQEEEHFLPLCLNLLAVIKEGLDIPQEFLLQSRTGVTGKGTSLLLSLARDLGASEVLLPYVSRKAVDWKDFEDAGIRVKFLRYEPLPYPQFWGAFVPRLSALDLLLCLGRDGRRLLEKASREVVV